MNDNQPEIDDAASAAINRHLENYIARFAKQAEAARGWPAKFSCPEPADDTEREALRLFCEEIESSSGRRIKITHV
jgi:hypothetical protein